MMSSCLSLLPLASAPHGSGGHSGPPELPNVLTLIFGHDPWVAHWMNVLFAMAIVVIICTLALKAYRHREMIPERRPPR